MLAVVSCPACIMIAPVIGGGLPADVAGHDVIGDEAAEQIVAGFVLLALDQLADVG